jgi:acyl-CoA synthetase (AMP-forming)/AMP-acid ligase II
MEGNNTALITFTTGSTGIPKAANRTHLFLWEQFRILKTEIGATPKDNCLVTLPIVLLSILGTGATGFVPDYNQKKPDKLDVKKQSEIIKSRQINLIISSPFYIHAIAQHITEPFPSVSKIITGGAPVFPKMASEINHAFPQSENVIAYGSTEAEPISTILMNDTQLDQNNLMHGLCVGEIHPEIELKIIRIINGPVVFEKSNWSELILNEGELGEIVVSGPHVLDNYYNSGEAFRLNKIDDGEKIWHRTEDSGKIVNGLLYLNGRCGQLIQRNDILISPFIVEQLLSTFEFVELGTIIENDNKLLIVIEKKGDLDFDFFKEELAKNGVIYDEIKFLDKFPRDPRHYSKIDYGKLQKLLD